MAASSENPFPRGIDTSKLDYTFHVARARAIERYAGLEKVLSLLFACLLNTSPELAGIVFFKITSSGYRNKVIDQLLDKRLGTKYDLYWHGTPQTKGLLSLIGQLDGRRNEIVHWHTTMRVNAEHIATGFALQPPNTWDTRPDRPSLDADDLDEFSKKAEFASGAVAAFFNLMCVGPSSFPSQAIADTWSKIFEQPASFPPSEGHPLYPSYIAPPAQPQSSGQ